MKRNLHWLALVGALVSGLFNSGCLVVSSYHVSKPVAPAETVEFHHPPQGDQWGWYIHHVRLSDADLDVSIANNTERFQVGFLFWLIPVPYLKSGSPDAEIKMSVQPAGSAVLIDPWRVEYHPTNGPPVSPFKIFRLENGSWIPVPRGPMLVNKPETFDLNYQAPCNPDLPFKLSIGGVVASDQTNSITQIDYQRSKIVRANFQLPY